MQAAKHILLVRPAQFAFNTETSSSNAFQQKPGPALSDSINKTALNEFDAFAETIRSKGVNVFIINDTSHPVKPDAVFPNNWVSFHEDGTVILYPMHAPNRRNERRMDILDTLKKKFNVSNIIDLTQSEEKNKFLEGTGSIVFDHTHKIAYACLSPRTDKDLFIKTAAQLKYAPVCFTAQDEKGREIYHTNVMMCISDKFAVVCTSSITNKQERQKITGSLISTGHTLIEITFEQMKCFAGNMLSVESNDRKSLTMLSKTAFDCLTDIQKKEIRKHSELVPIAIPTIERIGGGSVRCMMAEIFLQPDTSRP